MLKTTLWHEPEGFGFFVSDPEFRDSIDARASDEAWKNRFAVRRGFVKICVISEFTEIPITVEFDKTGPDPISEAAWDRIVECSIETKSNAIAFQSAVGDEFGRLEVPSGRYRLRICYGGQGTAQDTGESADSYLIQVWPSDDQSIRVVKPCDQ